MKPNFAWNEKKTETNLKKYRVSFDKSTTVFIYPFSITIPNPDHLADEQRYIDIGSSDKGCVLVLVYTNVLLTFSQLIGRLRPFRQQ